MSHYPLLPNQRPNKTLVYKAYTPHCPVPHEHLTVEYRPFDLADPAPPGGFTINNYYLKLDPSLREKMLVPGWAVGEAAVLPVIGAVMKSDNLNFKPGDHVTVMADAAEYAAVSAEEACSAVPCPAEPQESGLTDPMSRVWLAAYMSFKEFIKEIPGRATYGKTLVVSAASSELGQLVGQLAKSHDMRVIGSTDSDEKIDHLVNGLGFDGAWNYERESTSDALSRLAPGGVDTFYDMVGGEQLETTFANMNRYGNIVSCGMMSVLNPDQGKNGVHNLNFWDIVHNQISINGFLSSDPRLLRKYSPTFKSNMLAWGAVGSDFRTKPEVYVGIDLAPEAVTKMFGENDYGRVVVKISRD